MIKIKNIFFTLLFLVFSSGETQLEALRIWRPFIAISQGYRVLSPFTYSKDPFFKIYQEYTHKFLENLGYNRAKEVHVFEMSSWDENYQFAAGYSNVFGITLNLNQFRFGDSIASNLFVCAHEAAHIALGHTTIILHDTTNQYKKDTPPSTKKEREADIAAARMLCANGYWWVVEGHISTLTLAKKLEYSGGHPSLCHPDWQEARNYFEQILRETPRASDTSQEKTKIMRLGTGGGKRRFGARELFMMATIATAMVYSFHHFGR